MIDLQNMSSTEKNNIIVYSFQAALINKSPNFAQSTATVI